MASTSADEIKTQAVSAPFTGTAAPVASWAELHSGAMTPAHKASTAIRSRLPIRFHIGYSVFSPLNFWALQTQRRPPFHDDGRLCPCNSQPRGRTEDDIVSVRPHIEWQP